MMISTRPLKQTVWLLFSLMIVSGCTFSGQDKAIGKPLPKLTFQHLEPVTLKVSELEILNSYMPDSDENDESSRFPTPPDIAMKRYLERRWQGAGQDFAQAGSMIFEVLDARVAYQVINKQQGLRALWTDSAEDIFEVTVMLGLTYVNAEGRSAGEQVFTFERRLSLPQSMPIAQREHYMLRFTEDLITQIDSYLLEELDPYILKAY